MNDDALIKRYFTVPRQEIGYLRFTFEAYDNLIFMRTLNAKSGLIEVGYPPGLREDAEALLAAVYAEIEMLAAERPSDCEYDTI